MHDEEPDPGSASGPVTTTVNRILIVDDDPRIARVAARVATKVGFEPLVVTDSRQFEDEYGTFLPSVVLMDLDMPGRDGVELLRGLAEMSATAVVILMSGVDTRALNSSRRFGEDLGLTMAPAISKPFDIENLKEELSSNLLVDTHDLREELPGAIEAGQLFLCYQPKIDLKSDELSGVEALVRWRHPTHGELRPDQFIPLAEESGSIVSLTDAVLALALQDSRLWADAAPDISLAINISPSLLNDRGLADRIFTELELHRYDPAQLVVEVTETGATTQQDHAIDILTRLRIKGVQISIDDFGTGSSALKKLYQLPYGELKVDKSFVMDAMVSDEAAAIVKATILLGHSLGLTVVAEGVEDAETLGWLTELGCDVGQGYYISRPIPAPELVAWINDRTAAKKQ